MNPVLERAAQALCAHDWDALDRSHLTPEASEALKADYVERHWRQAVAQVRAVLGALREPTEGMVVSARDAVWDFSPDYASSKPDPKATNEDSAEYVAAQVWSAMISAALSE